MGYYFPMLGVSFECRDRDTKEAPSKPACSLSSEHGSLLVLPNPVMKPDGTLSSLCATMAVPDPGKPAELL